MSKLPGRFSKIYYGGYDLSGLSNQWEYNIEHAEVDMTGFEEDTENSIAGMPKGTSNVTVLLDPDTNKSHDALSIPGSYTDQCLCILMGQCANPIIGDPALALFCKQFKYSGKLETKSAVMADVSFIGAGLLPDVNGIILANETITNSKNFTDVDNEVKTLAPGGAGYLQVLIPTTNDTYVIKIQHSADKLTWSDLITFSANGKTRTSEMKSTLVTAEVERYLRAIATRTGTGDDPFGICVVFARHGAEEE